MGELSGACGNGDKCARFVLAVSCKGRYGVARVVVSDIDGDVYNFDFTFIVGYAFARQWIL